MLEKLFSRAREEVENTASLRSDIRLPKLTSARTCSRYEKRLVVFPVPPVLPPLLRPEDNERMRRAENEIQPAHRPGKPEERNNARFAKSSEKLCRVGGDASPRG